MRDLIGRVERLEKRVSVNDAEVLVLTIPYSQDMEADQAWALRQTGLTEQELQRRTVVFLVSHATR